VPPSFDKNLEEKILRAAQRLLRTRGERGLTLRAIAREARTTTPTVYQRFRNKERLRLALALRLRIELNASLFACKSLEEACRQYLHYAEQHPNEYKLIWASWMAIFRSDQLRPGLSWAMSQLAHRFGGNPQDHDLSAYALFLLCHAAASFLTVPGDDSSRTAIREHCLAACDALLQRPEFLSPRAFPPIR